MFGPQHTTPAAVEQPVAEDPMMYALIVLTGHGGLPRVDRGQERQRTGSGTRQNPGPSQIRHSHHQVNHKPARLDAHRRANSNMLGACRDCHCRNASFTRRFSS